MHSVAKFNYVKYQFVNLGPQAKSNTNATKIGNRVGLEAKHKPKQKPKPKEICPRFQQSSQTQYSNFRTRNAANRVDTDKPKLNSPKKTSNTQFQSKTSIKPTSKIAASSKYSADSVQSIRAQTTKPNAKSTATL